MAINGCVYGIKPWIAGEYNSGYPSGSEAKYKAIPFITVYFQAITD